MELVPDIPEPADSSPPPAAPSGLSSEAADLWNDWHAELDDDDLDADARETAILAEACRHLTIASRLEAALADLDSLVVPGSRGNQRVTPLVSEVDKVRRTVASLLTSIKQPVDRAEVGRANVAQRWSR